MSISAMIQPTDQMSTEKRERYALTKGREKCGLVDALVQCDLEKCFEASINKYILILVHSVSNYEYD